MVGSWSLRDVQPDQARRRASAHAAGRRHHQRLREFDGRDSEGQLAAGRGRYLWCDRHAMGEARRPDRSGVQQVVESPERGRLLSSRVSPLGIRAVRRRGL